MVEINSSEKNKSLNFHKCNYLHSIDGLRAIAVLSVILFHVDFKWAQGGYIGVDVFFVISGFLISSNILVAMKNGVWSFKDFYLRRIARLLPALFSVLILTLGTAYFILAPTDYNRLSISAFFAAISSSNLFFLSEADYFSQSAATKPLLHTWSLGVEEQFYIIWPIALYCIFSLKKNLLGFSVFIIMLSSFLSAIFLETNYPEHVFYLMPFRIFQFSIGTLVAIYFPITDRAWKAPLGFLSVTIIAFLVIWLSHDRSTIIVGMLLPAVSTALFLFSALSSPIRSVFASNPLIWIGRRSYSIYLIHWPVIVLWNMATDYQLSQLEKISAIFSSSIFGALLYQYIENRFRLTIKTTKSAKLNSYIFSGSAFFICLTICLTINLYYSFTNSGKLLINSASQITAASNALNSIDNKNIPPKKRCYMRKEDSPEDFGIEKCTIAPDGRDVVLVFGDSYAGGIKLALSTAYPELYFGHFVIPGCTLMSPQTIESKPMTQCSRHYKHAYNVISKGKFAGVALVSNWVSVSDKIINESIKYIQSIGATPIIVGLRPQFRERIPILIANSRSIEGASLKANNMVSQDTINRNLELYKFATDTTIFIDIYKVVCSGRCPIVDSNGNALYRDTSHFSNHGAVWLGNRLKKEYPKFKIELLSINLAKAK